MHLKQRKASMNFVVVETTAYHIVNKNAWRRLPCHNMDRSN